MSQSQCAYCKIHLVASAEDSGPEPPPVVTEGRSERLRRALDDARMRELWSYAAPAWSKRRDGVTLSDYETFACDVLLAVMGTALVALRGHDRQRLSTCLSIVSDRKFSMAIAGDVLTECQQYLDGEGRDACLEAAANLLAEADLSEQGYALAVGVVLVRGTISVEQGGVLDAIAAALGIESGQALQVREKIAKVMA